MSFKKQYAVLIAVSLIGAALSAALFFMIRDKEKLQTQADFQYQAQAQAVALRSALERGGLSASESAEGIARIVDSALKEFTGSELDVYIYDQISSEGDRLLYTVLASDENSRNKPPLTPEQMDLRSTLNIRSSFNAPGRQISAVIYPAPSFIWHHRTRVAWVALATGIFFTILLAVYFYSVIRSLQEITQAHLALKQAQSRLILADRLAMLGQVAAGVAHEINNPVGFVSSNLETFEKYLDKISHICRNVPEDEKRFILEDLKPLLAESRSGLERIKKIVANLRTFATADVKDTVEPADLHRILEGALSIAWNEIKYKAEVQKDYGPLPVVRVHTQQIGQVFINLLVNAAQAIAEKGTIFVRTAQENGFALVEIRDDGPGLSEDARKHLFEPFFTTKEAGRGTGLGLSISDEIIKKHGGRIEVKSEPGQGACFRIYLPL